MSTNEHIIIEEGIKNGVFTETEAEMMLIYGQDPPLHSASYWASKYHKYPKKGTHGIPTKLWKRSKDKTNEDKDRFVLVRSYLFTEDQVEDIK